MSEIENKKKITVPAPDRVLAEVTAWPDEVVLAVNAPDGALTPAQAREVAIALNEAADLAESVAFTDSEDPTNTELTYR